MEFKKGQNIVCKNFDISIGIFDSREVALFSKITGKFVKMNKANLKRSKKLRKVKRLFKTRLNSKDTFTFSFMQPSQIEVLIRELKTK